MDMKRIILPVVLLLMGHAAFAQDIITKKDGAEIQAKILEINESDIKYKKFSNLEGPVYSMSISDILMIRYQNGENDVFPETPKTQTVPAAPKPLVFLNTEMQVFPGMRYRDYKDFYDTSRYIREPGDPYNPFWVGFASFFIPGLGEAITGEWGRAAAFFFTNVGLASLRYSQVMTYTRNGQTYIQYTPMYWVALAAGVGLNVWSICDAVHISKVKNMYNQDLRAQRASLDLKLEPFFSYMPYNTTGVQPVTGLSLKVNF